MSARNRTHNGRDLDGHFKVRQADVEDLETDPKGTDFIRDDVRLGGGCRIDQKAQHRALRPAREQRGKK